MINRKIPAYYFFIFLPLCLLLGIACSYIYLNKKYQSEVQTQSVPVNSCQLNVKRLTDYRYIQPLLYAKTGCEAEDLQSARQEMSQVIDNYKQSGILTSASVYLRVYGQGDWMSINDDETYRPGSLLKVPELITFLKDNELHPGILDRVLVNNLPLVSNKKVVFISKSIEPGKSYTVRELLKYMIKYSDNNATMLLNRNMNGNLFKKVFTDFGLKEPDMKATDYHITAKDYSLFMEGIYNAGYLTIDDSELAADLLTNCDFKLGLVGGIPTNVEIAHKFGEAGDDNIHELHESGIVYCGAKRYEITVMTKGKNLTELPDVIKNISKIAYNKINS